MLRKVSLILQPPLLTRDRPGLRWLGIHEVVDLGVHLESLPLARRVRHLLGPRDRGQKRGQRSALQDPRFKLCLGRIAGGSHMFKPGEIGGPLRRLIHQTCSLEDVKSFGGRLDQGFGGGWKLFHNVVQQKSQRSRTKIVLVILLIVPLSAI